MKNSNRGDKEHVGRYVTIFKRGRVYHAEVYVHGVRTRRSLRTHNKKEARAKALDMDAQVQRGEAVKRPARIAIEEAKDLYLECAEGEGKRPRTLTQYHHDLGAFLGFAARKHAQFLDQVTLFLAEQYRATLRKEGYAPQTIQHRLVIVKQLVNWAVERDLLAQNPLKGLRIGKSRPRPQPCFSLGEVERILAFSSGPLRAILEVLAFTGLRISVLVWLTWMDVDFERGFLIVRPKDDWVPKHGRTRVVPMHDRARAVLETLPRRHRWVFTARASRNYPDGGHQISTTHTLEKLKKVLRRLGIEGSLHTFRHFFISHCANSGVPPFQLIKWVGHANVSTVMQYYALRDEESLSAMQRLSWIDRGAEVSRAESAAQPPAFWHSFVTLRGAVKTPTPQVLGS